MEPAHLWAASRRRRQRHCRIPGSKVDFFFPSCRHRQETVGVTVGAMVERRHQSQDTRGTCLASTQTRECIPKRWLWEDMCSHVKAMIIVFSSPPFNAPSHTQELFTPLHKGWSVPRFISSSGHRSGRVSNRGCMVCLAKPRHAGARRHFGGNWRLLLSRSAPPTSSQLRSPAGSSLARDPLGTGGLTPRLTRPDTQVRRPVPVPRPSTQPTRRLAIDLRSLWLGVAERLGTRMTRKRSHSNDSEAQPLE